MKQKVIITFCISVLVLLSIACDNKSKEMTFEYIGIAAEKEGMHVWGSSPVIDQEGKVHLYAAQWSKDKRPNFNGWYKDCEIGHYVSDSPEGPFEYIGVAVSDSDGAFNSPHNPTIHYIDGKYVLCFIVNENSKLRTQRIVMYVADDLDDKWRPAAGADADGTILRKPQDSTIWNYEAKLGVSNPSLIKFNDKYLLYHKSVVPKQPKGSAYTYGVAISDNLEGPYEIQPNKVTSHKMQLEDAYAFTMNDSVYMLSRDFVGTLGNSGGGLLWCSEDGLHFPKENTKRAYEALEHYIGKEALQNAEVYRGKIMGKLERAQILSIKGKPAYLYLATGVQVKPGYGSSSHVFRIVYK